MYLYRYRERPNFGDDLNDYIWPKYINVKLGGEEDTGEVFVGIGTLLNERLPEGQRLHIMGSGFGYGRADRCRKDRWIVHFVRGPITAQALSLSPSLAISDPAILLHRTEGPEPPKEFRCAFMPHHEINSHEMRNACEAAGIQYIDPQHTCEAVIFRLRRAEGLICSAMHGAIAAEALRIPWLPVITHREMLLSKWEDWGAAMGMQIKFHMVPTIWPGRVSGAGSKLTSRIKSMYFAKRLVALSKSSNFCLGAEKILSDRIDRIEEKIAKFNRHLG